MVAAVLVTGSEKAAAHRLGLSHSTVKHHLANARTKVGATTTAQLVWILAPRLPEPGGPGPSDEQVGDLVRKHFRYHGRFMLAVRGRSRMGLLFGLEAGSTGEARFTVWLEADPGYADIRSRVQALAASAGLPASGWGLRDDGWQIVECRARTEDYATIDSALAWFMERFGELERAGLFALHRELAGTS